ncbi:MAG TPA: hypothetical protein VFS32_03290 [Candidatus Limnocylindrales bacterium]|nr:hypothetical protein [Candidatus Limnocylindrales bacterium]
MREPAPEFERKLLYSVFEVASITGRPPGLVKRWIYRGQLQCVRIDDEAPFVPFDALVERLERLAWKRRRREEVRAREAGQAAAQATREVGPEPVANGTSEHERAAAV